MLSATAALAAEGLKTDWSLSPTYNTIMAVAAGAGLVTLVRFVRDLWVKQERNIDGYAFAFGILGFILTTTGLHMTLTWPIKGLPWDNIIFGETSLGFGVLLAATSWYLWRNREALRTAERPIKVLADLVRPISLFVFGLGLALVGIGVAGLWYQFFVAPAEEPISGLFADYPIVEAIFMSGLFFLVALGALLFPWAVKREAVAGEPGTVHQVAGWAWVIGGLGFFLFGALNFFTHIGLIFNTNVPG